MIKSSFLFFLLVSTFAFSQTRKQIQGNIIVVDAMPSGVHVINLNTEEEVVSDKEGIFYINGAEGDLLVFSAEHLDYMRKIIEEDEMQAAKISIEMTSKKVILDEVEIINYNRINAVSLGILAKPAKKYTPAERRLYGATSSPLDGLINMLTGRTAMLEDGVEIEQKQFALDHLDGLYPEAFYTETLKIPKEEMGGFHYFIVEDMKFKEALKGNNSFLVTFLMIKLALDYKAIRNAE